MTPAFEAIEAQVMELGAADSARLLDRLVQKNRGGGRLGRITPTRMGISVMGRG